MDMSEPVAPRTSSMFGTLSADVRAERRVALHALHVLEYALTAPAPRRHRTWLHRVTIAVASLREQIEPDPAIEINPEGIRDRLATLTQQFRQHQAREADLVYETTGLELDEEL